MALPAGPAAVFWAGEAAAFAEEGAPYPVGLARYGLALDRLIVVRAKKREEALWAAEQALAAAGAVVICALGARGKPLDLKASRRLLLFAERNARWADWIDRRLDTPGTVFIAVGAGHLAGRDSVQANLAARGVGSARIN